MRTSGASRASWSSCLAESGIGAVWKRWAADADKRNDQQELQRIGEVVGELRGSDVEPEDEGQREAENRGGTEDGVDADESADGEAPGQLLWGCSAAEKSENWKDDAAVDPSVVRECLVFGHC